MWSKLSRLGQNCWLTSGGARGAENDTPYARIVRPSRKSKKAEACPAVLFYNCENATARIAVICDKTSRTPRIEEPRGEEALSQKREVYTLGPYEVLVARFKTRGEGPHPYAFDIELLPGDNRGNHSLRGYPRNQQSRVFCSLVNRAPLRLSTQEGAPQPALFASFTSNKDTVAQHPQRIGARPYHAFLQSAATDTVSASRFNKKRRLADTSEDRQADSAISYALTESVYETRVIPDPMQQPIPIVSTAQLTRNVSLFPANEEHAPQPSVVEERYKCIPRHFHLTDDSGVEADAEDDAFCERKGRRSRQSLRDDKNKRNLQPCWSVDHPQQEANKEIKDKCGLSILDICDRAETSVAAKPVSGKVSLDAVRASFDARKSSLDMRLSGLSSCRECNSTREMKHLYVPPSTAGLRSGGCDSKNPADAEALLSYSSREDPQTEELFIDNEEKEEEKPNEPVSTFSFGTFSSLPDEKEEEEKEETPPFCSEGKNTFSASDGYSLPTCVPQKECDNSETAGPSCSKNESLSFAQRLAQAFSERDRLLFHGEPTLPTRCQSQSPPSFVQQTRKFPFRQHYCYRRQQLPAAFSCPERNEPPREFCVTKTDGPISKKTVLETKHAILPVWPASPFLHLRSETSRPERYSSTFGDAYSFC